MSYIEFQIRGLRNALGYFTSDEGLCAGTAQSSINAFCIDKAIAKDTPTYKENKELARLMQRYEYLNRHEIDDIKSDIDNLYKLIKTNKNYQLTEQDWELLDMAAFISNVDIYTNTFNYNKILNMLSSDMPERIAELIQPKVLADRGGLQVGYIQTKMFNKTSLEQYCNTLIATLKERPTDVAISIGTGDHRVSICYDVDTNKWICTEPKRLPPEMISSNALFDWLATAAELDDSNHACLHFKFFSSGNRKAETESFENKFKMNLAKVGLDKPTFEETQVMSHNGFPLLSLAVKYHDVPLIEVLAKFKGKDNSPLDFNRPDQDGLSPILTAGIYNHNDLIFYFATLKADDGSLRMNFNAQSRKGRTILHYAIMDGNKDLFDFLVALKKPNGMWLMDFNIINKAGENALEVAVKWEEPEMIRKLCTLIDSNGVFIVNSSALKNYDTRKLNDATYQMVRAIKNRDSLLEGLAYLKKVSSNDPQFAKMRSEIVKEFCNDPYQFTYDMPSYVKRAAWIEEQKAKFSSPKPSAHAKFQYATKSPPTPANKQVRSPVPQDKSFHSSSLKKNKIGSKQQ